MECEVEPLASVPEGHDLSRLKANKSDDASTNNSICNGFADTGERELVEGGGFEPPYS